MTLAPDDPRHGTTTGYQRHGCRCAECKTWMAQYMRAWRAKNRRRRRLSSDPTDPRHGTVNGYQNYGCRCDRCRDASRVAHDRGNPLISAVLDAARELCRCERLGLGTARAAHDLRGAVVEYERSQRKVAS